MADANATFPPIAESPAPAVPAAIRPSSDPYAMSPEEEKWLDEQLEIQLIEAELADMRTANICNNVHEEEEEGDEEAEDEHHQHGCRPADANGPSNDTVSHHLTPEEQDAFDAWIESQTVESHQSGEPTANGNAAADPQVVAPSQTVSS